MSEKKLNFYGKVDRDRYGRIMSMYPAWMMEVHIENLEEEVGSLKRQIAAGKIPAAIMEETKGRLYKLEERLEEIEEGRPQLSVGERERLQKVWKEELCPMIQDSLFTRSQMMKGIAPAHEEARRMVRGIFEPTKTLMEVADACGVKLKNGKFSRNQLAKMFKIVGKLIGEPTNVEVLRKD